MVLYQVFCQVSEADAEDWSEWMCTQHIPRVMASGCFDHYNFMEDLGHAQEGSRVFCTVYEAPDVEAYEHYRDTFAPALQAEVRERYGDRIQCHRHLLESLKEA